MVAASSLVAMTLFAGNAAAEDENKWSITLRFGMLTASQVEGSAGPMTELGFQWHASEHARLGGYVAKHRFLDWRDHAYYEGANFKGERGGVRGEWHFRPSAVIDPWVGAAAGVFHYAERYNERVGAGVDVSGDGGVDFHLGSHFIVGLLVSATIPLSNWDVARGVSTSAFMEVWVFPNLRIGASF